MTGKYEKVTDMTVGQVVDAILEGEKVYYKNYQGEYSALHLDIDLIGFAIKEVRIYRKIEAPWWEKHVGGLVMVRDYYDSEWYPAYFKGYIKNSERPFKMIGSRWKHMRPLTAEEKNAIITEG